MEAKVLWQGQFLLLLIYAYLLIAQHQFEKPAASNPFSHDSAKFKFYSQNKFAVIGYRGQILYTRPSYISRIQGLISNHQKRSTTYKDFGFNKTQGFAFLIKNLHFRMDAILLESGGFLILLVYIIVIECHGSSSSSSSSSSPLSEQLWTIHSLKRKKHTHKQEKHGTHDLVIWFLPPQKGCYYSISMSRSTHPHPLCGPLSVYHVHNSMQVIISPILLKQI